MNLFKNKRNYSRLFAPFVDKKELNALKGIINRQWLGLGPNVEILEREWENLFSNRTCIATNSGTAALHLSLLINNFNRGDKVLVPNLTFISSASAVLYCGLQPVLVDINPSTLSVSVDDLEEKFCSNKNIKAVVIVHYAGHPAPMEEIIPWAKERNIVVIEDCAHTTIVNYKGKLLGEWGDFGCFSFEEKKIMTAGDGGMIVSKDTNLKSRLKAFRWVGIDKDTWRASNQYIDKDSIDSMHWYYEINELGYKYNMNDLSASIALTQMSKLSDIKKRRREIVKTYMECLSKCKLLKPCIEYSNSYVYQIFAILSPKKDFSIRFFKQKGIATGCHYTPLSEQPLLHAADESEASYPHSENIYNQLITIPLHPLLSKKDMRYICNSIKELDYALSNTATCEAIPGELGDSAKP